MGNRVLVIGDNMLDVHTYCKCTRLSPEAPVPIGLFEREINILGGAANVASQIAVATNCTLGSIRSQGWIHEDFVKLCITKRIDLLWLDTSGCYYLPEKRRIWLNGQQNTRVDIELEHPIIPPEDRKQWLASLINHIEAAEIRVVIFSDYNKGTLTDEMLQELAKYCAAHSIMTILDPKRPSFVDLKFLSIIKPNEPEIKATRLSPAEISQIISPTFLIVTRGAKGAECFQSGKLLTTMQPHCVEVCDVCGAGDTVASFIALSLLLKAELNLNEITIRRAMSVASFAASRTVQHRGSYVLDNEETKNVLSIGW